MKEKRESSNSMLIIVAGIMIASIFAAAAIIATSGGLEKVSMKTLENTQKDVASNFDVFYITGHDASDDGEIEQLELFIKLMPGADPINWNKTSIVIDYFPTYQNLIYDDSGSPASSTTKYAIYYLRHSGPDNLKNFLKSGDSAIMNISLLKPLGPKQKVFIHMIPERGNIMRLTFSTPQTMTYTRVQLYP